MTHVIFNILVMCTNKRQIINPYTRHRLWVDCGHCSACLQKKANARRTRILNHLFSGQIFLFVTLTYDSEHVPYIKLSDIESRPIELPIYRGNEIIDRVIPCYENLHKKFLPELIGLPGCVGVSLFEDVKKFFKRLRIILERHYGLRKILSYFASTEYGPTTQRPHAHLLIAIPYQYETVLRDCIVKAWTYADRGRTSKYIEIARNAASYVSTYVNCGSYVHPFLSENFKTKSSMSKGFGVGNKSFSLLSLLDMLRKKDLRITIASGNAECAMPPVLLPSYVINRYFPKFKGFGSLSRSEVYKFVRDPLSFFALTYYDDIYIAIDSKVPRQQKLHLDSREPRIIYTPDYLRSMSVRFANCYFLYHELTGRSRYDYALDYYEIWQCYTTNLLHDFMLSDVPSLYRYDNIAEVQLTDMKLSDEQLAEFEDDFQRYPLLLSPNEFPVNVSDTFRLSETYNRKIKQKKTTNYIMSSNGHFV